MRDEEIIDLYFERNECAIVETSHKYGAYCHKVAYNILSDIFDADECVNDTYHRAWTAMPPKRPTRLGAFLAKITRNLALDRCDKKRASKRGGVICESLDELMEIVGNEEFSLELSELATLISEFLRGEKEIARRLFVQRYFFESRIGEIAASHGLSEGRVKSQLFRFNNSSSKSSFFKASD